MTEAYYIAGLTRHRGWSEDFVRWELPPWRGMAYLHADLVDEGVDVVWADRDNDPNVIAFRAVRDEVRAKAAEPRLKREVQPWEV